MLNREMFRLGQEYSKKLLTSLNACPTPYHVVSNACTHLKQQGFKFISEAETWKIIPGGKYITTRNMSTLIAFSVGKQFNARESAFNIMLSHSDFPAIKLPPISIIQSEQYTQAAIQVYGGGNWPTWFDRDLGVAGKAVVKHNDKLESRLFHINRPLFKIPTLAIQYTKSFDKLEFNVEKHLRPIISTIVADQLLCGLKKSEKHHHSLISLIADNIGVQPENIVDCDISLVDTQPAQLLGINEEFISAGHLDNQLSAQCQLSAWLKTHQHSKFLDQSKDISMIAMFDHEEVLSLSMHGAAGNFLPTIVKRMMKNLISSSDFEEVYQPMIRRSFMISADTAHVLHPNYPEAHQQNHKPAFHKGIVIKNHINLNYTTDAVSTAIMREICKIGSIPLQDFVVKTDALSGKSLGPLCAQQLGIKAVDIGMGQLSMHSIRETCSTTDVAYYIGLFSAFLESMGKINKQILFN